jgi:GT2 family glycosyltransferase
LKHSNTETLKHPEKTDIVIVAYNRKSVLFESLPILFGCDLVEKIIIVDNASSDGLCTEGPARFPDAEWICLAENEGCTAWNIGMSATVSEYALILDDDCVPDIPSVYAAMEAMKNDAGAGLAAFNILNLYSGKSEWGNLEDTDGSGGWANAIGACMLVRVQAFFKAEGYKDFFLCFNDTDLVLSLWDAGYKVIYNKKWLAFHKQKIVGTKKRRFFFEVRNLLGTVWGHLEGIPAILITAKFIAGALYDARNAAEYSGVLRGFGSGLVTGLIQRRKRRGNIPPHILKLFYENFFIGKRLPEGLKRIFLSLSLKL